MKISLSVVFSKRRALLINCDSIKCNLHHCLEFVTLNISNSHGAITASNLLFTL